MRPGRAAGGAASTDDLTAMNPLTGNDFQLGHVRIVGLEAAAMIDLYHSAIAACPFRQHNVSVSSGVYRSTPRDGNVDSGMEGAFARKWIRPAPEITHQTTVDRPHGG